MKGEFIEAGDGSIQTITLTVDNIEYIKIDDVIKWLKTNQQRSGNVPVHLLIKALVKVKNTK